MAAPQAEMSMMEWAIWNAEKGFRVFPIRENAKFPPLMERPYDAATTDVVQIINWWTSHPNANIGVDTSDMLVIDIDVKEDRNGYVAAGELGILEDATFVVTTPTGGQHRYYRVDSPCAGAVGALGLGIDTRGFHNYVLAAGSRVPAGDYIARNDGPLIRASDRIKSRAPVSRENTSLPLVDLDTPGAIALAMECARTIAPAVEGEGGDQHTYAVAARLRDYGVSEDMCFGILADAWNERCSPPWDLDELKSKVEHAYRYAQNQPGISHPDHVFGDVQIDLPPPPPAPVRTWWDAEDADENLEDEWLFYDLLPKTGVCLVIAPPGGGKTFLTTHLMDCVRTGEPFFGIAPDDKGSSLILASEAVGSAKKRLRALKRIDTPHRIRVRPVGALASPEAWRKLRDDVIAEARSLEEDFGEPVRVISLDTLASSGILVDENDNSQAALVMNLLSELAETLKCLILLVHHTVKTGKGERGASSLRGGADAVLEIRYDEGSQVRNLELTKSRDGECKPVGSFTLLPTTIGIDSRGRPIKTALLSTGGPSPINRAGHRPVKADKFLEALDNVLAVPNGSEVRDGAVEKFDLRKEFRQAAGFPDGKSQNSNVKNAFDRCLTYFLTTSEVESVLIEGTEYIRRKEIEI